VGEKKKRARTSTLGVGEKGRNVCNTLPPQFTYSNKGKETDIRLGERKKKKNKKKKGQRGKQLEENKERSVKKNRLERGGHPSDAIKKGEQERDEGPQQKKRRRGGGGNLVLEGIGL